MSGRKQRFEPEPKEQPGPWDDDTQRIVDDMEMQFRREFNTDEAMFDDDE